MIRFYTSGVIGTDVLWAKLRRDNPQARAYTWAEFQQAADQKYWPEFLTSDFLIQLLPDYPADDLKTATDDSPLLKYHRGTLQHLCPFFAADSHQISFVGHEHGLGFVPMITRHREQIRRETALAAEVMPYASSYQIMFPGESFLTVFSRS